MDQNKSTSRAIGSGKRAVRAIAPGTLIAFTAGMRNTGLESRFLDLLPQLHLAVVVPSLVIAVFSADTLTTILALGVAIAWGMLLIPCAIACMIVVIAKGPRRYADSYPLPDSDLPRVRRRGSRAGTAGLQDPPA
jgi:hypothetical protein